MSPINVPLFLILEDLTAKKQAEKIRSKITEKREKREIEKKLKAVKGLGEDSDEEDASDWVKKSRKLEEERLKAQLKVLFIFVLSSTSIVYVDGSFYYN